MNQDSKLKSILILSTSLDYHDVGINRFLQELMENIDQMKFKIEHYSMFRFDDDALSKEHFLKSQRTKYITQIPKFIYNLILFFKVVKKYDLVHVNYSMIENSFYRGMIFHFASIIAGKSTILFIHGWDDQFYNRLLKRIILKCCFKKFLAVSKSIVVQSKKNWDLIVELDGTENVVQITTMVNTNKYRNMKEIDQRKTLLFCGRMERTKGIFELLDAIPIILQKFPDVTLNFLGDGSQLENIRIQIRKMGLQEKVSVLGYRPVKEKLELYKKSGIFLLPSYTEGFPTVICEAMASGLAVVATPVGGIADLLTDGANGFFIRSMPPDPREIAQKVMDIVDDPNLFLNMSKNNVQIANDILDSKQITRKIESIYHTALT